jgi:hypothetical protein
MSVTVRFQDGDIEFGTAGDQTLVANAEKAAQDLLDEVLLPYEVSRDRGNELFNLDGSLVSIVGSDVIGASFIETNLQSATKRLMNAQSTARTTTPVTERIQRIKTIIVQPLGDVTSYGFFLAVEVNDETIALSRAIRMNHLGVPSLSVGGYGQ